MRRRQHPLHYAAGAVRLIVWLSEAPHLAAQTVARVPKYASLLFRGDLGHLENPADQSDRGYLIDRLGFLWALRCLHIGVPYFFD